MIVVNSSELYILTHPHPLSRKVGSEKNDLIATSPLASFRSNSDLHRRVTKFNTSVITNLLNYVV